MADAAPAEEFLVDGKPVFDDAGERILTKNAYKKYVAKKEKEAKKAAHKAERGGGAPADGGGGGGKGGGDEAPAPSGPVTYTKEEPKETFGDLTTVQSNQDTGRQFVHVSQIDAAGFEGKDVWVRCRVHNTRSKGNNCFLVLRQSGSTLQGAMFKSEAVSKEMIKFSGSLARETIVDVKGTVVRADVKSCTQSDVELSVLRIYVVSRAEPNLPLQIEDAGRSEAEIVESEKKKAAGEIEGAYIRVGNEIRLDNRVIDLRVPAQNAILRIKSAVCHYYRSALLERGFCEIQTPKMIAGASEGGADVFKFKYMEGSRFERPACLAQSPQLYKQMAIMGDMERVFEVGPVFRAENSHTGRHLTEFTGLDFEMEIKESYSEALDMTDYFMCRIFEGLRANHQRDLQVISQQYPFEPLKFNATGRNYRMQYPEAVRLMREAGLKNEDGSEISDTQDLSTPLEKWLGDYVAKHHQTDFWVLERYPYEARPFYTMPCADDPRYTNSYDVFMRGQEIMSGAQRVHTADLLTKQCGDKGVDPKDLAAYIDAFKYGASPHAGGGIGLERVVSLYLGLDNVRKTSMFPRDPTRLTP